MYKGCLSDGKQAAVKVLRSYKEAWNDFSFEVDITSSLEQKSITTLNGVCIEDNYLILVSDFLPKGSLEESLHGKIAQLLRIQSLTMFASAYKWPQCNF